MEVNGMAKRKQREVQSPEFKDPGAARLARWSFL